MAEHPGQPLDELADALEAKLVRIAGATDQLVSRTLKAWLRQLDEERMGETLYRREQVEQLLRMVEQLLLEAFGPASAYARLAHEGLGRAGQLGAEMLVRQVLVAGGLEIARRLVLDAQTVAAAALDVYSLAARNLTLEAVGELRDTLTRYMVQGSGKPALAAELAKGGWLEDLTITDELGRTRVLRAEVRARMMARTELHRLGGNTYREAAARLEPKAEDRIFRWVSVLLPNTAKDSLRRHGLMLSEPEWLAHPFGDGFFGFPPLRPNDRCSVVFFRRSWLKGRMAEVLGLPAGAQRRVLVNAGDAALLVELAGGKRKRA